MTGTVLDGPGLAHPRRPPRDTVLLAPRIPRDTNVQTQKPGGSGAPLRSFQCSSATARNTSEPLLADRGRRAEATLESTQEAIATSSSKQPLVIEVDRSVATGRDGTVVVEEAEPLAVVIRLKPVQQIVQNTGKLHEGRVFRLTVNRAGIAPVI